MIEFKIYNKALNNLHLSIKISDEITFYSICKGKYCNKWVNLVDKYLNYITFDLQIIHRLKAKIHRPFLVYKKQSESENVYSWII